MQIILFLLGKNTLIAGGHDLSQNVVFQQKGMIMSKTILALLLALSVPMIHAQGTTRQSEYQNPPSTKGSGTSRADVKAEERAAGSMGTRQSEYSDPAKRRKGQTAASNDGAPVNDAFTKSRDEKAAAKRAYKQEKSTDRAAYKQSKKESSQRLKASNERSEAGKNLEVPR